MRIKEQETCQTLHERDDDDNDDDGGDEEAVNLITKGQMCILWNINA